MKGESVLVLSVLVLGAKEGDRRQDSGDRRLAERQENQHEICGGWLGGELA